MRSGRDHPGGAGDDRGDQWPGSRVISAQKANTANAFSLPALALSTANLYTAVQPGGSLFGLQESNPVNPEVAYAGKAEDFALVFIADMATPGAKLLCRNSYEDKAISPFDHPLSSRFDENDATFIFDNVFVPWENVFIYRNLEVTRDQWSKTPAHLYGNHQAQVRYATKLRQLANEAIASGDLTRIYAGRKVRHWFALMDGKSVDLNRVRMV